MKKLLGFLFLFFACSVASQVNAQGVVMGDFIDKPVEGKGFSVYTLFSASTGEYVMRSFDDMKEKLLAAGFKVTSSEPTRMWGGDTETGKKVKGTKTVFKKPGITVTVESCKSWTDFKIVFTSQADKKAFLDGAKTRGWNSYTTIGSTRRYDSNYPPMLVEGDKIWFDTAP